MNKFVLFSNSNTQRVAVEVNGDSLLLSKEWRRTAQDEWKTGKGIEIPKQQLIKLIKILKEDNCYE